MLNFQSQPYPEYFGSKCRALKFVKVRRTNTVVDDVQEDSHKSANRFRDCGLGLGLISLVIHRGNIGITENNMESAI